MTLSYSLIRRDLEKGKKEKQRYRVKKLTLREGIFLSLKKTLVA
jgi:hypothetical protein